jgi:alpha-tubulin suppressor-like RCC1 family protein
MNESKPHGEMPLLPQKALGRIADLLDDHSLIALSKSSRFFCDTLGTIISKRITYDIASNNSFRVIRTADGKIYYTHSVSNKLSLRSEAVNWQRIDLSEDVNVVKMTLSNDYCYFLVYNTLIASQEIWHCNITEQMKTPLSSISIRAQKLYMPSQVNIKKIFINSNCIFALTVDGKLYSWSEEASAEKIAPSPLGRVAVNIYDATTPSPVNLPENFHCVDLRVTRHQMAIAISSKSDLCSWGKNQTQKPRGDENVYFRSLPKTIRLPEPELITSLDELTFAIDRIYFPDKKGNLFCLGNCLCHLPEQESTTGLAKIRIPNLSRVKRVFAFDTSTFITTEHNDCYAWGCNRNHRLGVGAENTNLVTTPTKVNGINGEIIDILTTAAIFSTYDFERKSGATLFITKSSIYYSGFALSNRGEAKMPIENEVQLSTSFAKTHQLSSTPTAIDIFPQNFEIQSYTIQQGKKHFQLIASLKNMKKSLLIACTFTHHSSIMPDHFGYSICWISPANNDPVLKMLIRQSIWLVTSAGAVYEWVIGNKDKLTRLPLSCSVELADIDDNGLLLLGRNRHQIPVFFFMQKLKDGLRYRSDEVALLEIGFPLMRSGAASPNNPSSHPAISLAHSFCELYFSSIHYCNSGIYYDLLLPILSLANGHLHAKTKIQFNLLRRSMPPDIFSEAPLLDELEKLRLACVSDSAIAQLKPGLLAEATSTYNFYSLPKPIILNIAGLLDGYSLVALSQTSDSLHRLIASVIIKKMRFIIQNDLTSYLLRSPDGRLYYGEAQKIDRGNSNEYIDWQRIELPPNRYLLKTYLSHKKCYVMAHNSETLRNELWRHEAPAYMGMGINTLSAEAEPVGFPDAINIIKVIINDYCNFALSDQGLLYSWCTTIPSGTIPPLGRSVLSDDDYTQPRLVSLPHNVFIKDIHVTSFQSVWVISNHLQLYSWGNQIEQFSANPRNYNLTDTPRHINLFHGKSIESFSQLDFCLNRTYFRDSANELFSIDHKSAHSKPIVSVISIRIHKLVATPNFTFLISDSGECYTLSADNHQGPGGDESTAETLPALNKICGISGVVFDVITAENILSLESLNLFVAATGIYYIGLWSTNCSEIEPTQIPLLLPDFPKGVEILNHKICRTSHYIGIVVLVKFQNQSGLFYFRLYTHANNTDEPIIKYYTKHISAPKDDPIIKLWLREGIHFTTESGIDYRWDIYIQNSLIKLPARCGLIERLSANDPIKLPTYNSPNKSRFSDCGLTLFSNMPALMVTNASHNTYEGYNSAALTKTGSRFPLLWSSAIHEANQPNHARIKLAILFCQLYFSSISYRYSGKDFDQIKPVMMLANGYINAQAKINFERLKESLPFDCIKGEFLQPRLEALRKACSDKPPDEPNEPIVPSEPSRQKCTLM